MFATAKARNLLATGYEELCDPCGRFEEFMDSPVGP